MKVPINVRIGDPTWNLLLLIATYVGVTSAAGAAGGTTVVDNLCGTAGLQPSYANLKVKLLDGNAAGQERLITNHNLATGTLTVTPAFTDYNGAVYQVPAGLRFAITSGSAPFDSSIIDNIATRQLLCKDQWCATPIAALAITNVAADLTLSNVVFPTGFLPAGITIDSIYLLFHWRKQFDSSGVANAINGANKRWRVKKSTGAWGTDDVVGITLADNSLATAADATEGGSIMIGDVDISGEVDDVDNETYNIRGDQTNRADAPVVDGASLTLYDIFTGLRVYYRV